MKQYKKARTSMVQSQIQPNDVYDEDVLEAFEATPRERFVPEHLKDVAYIDEDISYAGHHFLLEPITHARIIQAAKSDDINLALVVGCGMGYGVAILSRFVSTVIGIDEDLDMIEKGSQVLNDLELSNTALFKGDLKQGYAVEAPYQLIILEGSVAQVPDVLLEQLSDNGKLFAIERGGDLQQGQAVCYLRQGNAFIRQYLFDANSPFVKGYEPKAQFQF